MENRSKFLTFVSACIPGIGYMYQGLIKKGVQVLLLFILIEPVFNFIGLHFLAELIKIPFWFYTFFDTFAVAKKVNRGEFVPDSEFIFKNYVNSNSFEENKAMFNEKINKQRWTITGFILVGLGALALLNQIFIDSDFYKLLRSNATQYFMPVALIVIGAFILFKRRE